MEAVKSTQGKITGVIIPPPEIRAVVDKTAAFVAKIGKSFEQRVLASEEGKTAKFNFMRPFDPYHAYYEMKIREGEEIKSGNVPTEEAKNSDSAHAAKTSEENLEKEKAKATLPTSVATAVKATILNPIAQLAKTKPTEAPLELEFSVASSHPAGLSPFDVDVIKLTAQYTSVNGREFLANLALREQRNPQFDFLKPTHMLFSYFTYLVDCYAKILHPTPTLTSNIELKCNFNNAMECSVRRWQWRCAEAERKRSENSENSEERMAFQAIDWFDFTVVETIDFPEGELLELDMGQSEPVPPPPAPTTTTNTINTTTNTTINTSATNTTTTTSNTSSYFAPTQTEEEVVMVEDEVEEVEDLSDLKVVTDYQHSSVRNNNNTALLMIDPISGKNVPISQMSEHMRIQLLDPRWREQQARFVDKQRETGYAEGGSIADSLKNFARKRGDIFGQAAVGSGPNTATAIAEQEELERRKNEIQSQVQWDGHYGTIGNVQGLKHELVSKAPAAFQLPSSAIRAASTIGPAATAPVVAHYTLPASSVQHGNGPPPGAISLPTITLSAQLQTQVTTAPPPPSLPPAFQMAPPPPPMTYSAPVPVTQAPLPQAPPPGYSGQSLEQANKRARVDPSEPVLMPADQFAALFGTGEVTLHIQVPAVNGDASVPAAWNLQGQTVSVVLQITSTVKQLKEVLAEQLGGMPANKQQIKAGLGFLKDANTLAELNLGDGAVVEMSLKSRGGKR